MRVAWTTGIIVARDAVSDSVVRKLGILGDLAAAGAPLEVTAFTLAADRVAEEIVGVHGVTELLRHDRFWDADVHCFEYAMPYSLFDALAVVPSHRPRLVFDHNTTPPELVDDPAGSVACEAADSHRTLMAVADRVATDSRFDADALVNAGVEPERIRVLGLPAAHVAGGTTRRSSRRGPVRLVFLGRLVRAKGVTDLLAAARWRWAAGDDAFTLTLAGNAQFSDPAIVEAAREEAARFGGRRLQVVLDPEDAEVEQLLGAADVLVVPSYHEGFCVPAVEAMASGCYVVASDAGNLPDVLGGLGSVVRTGDVPALAAALGDVVARFSAARLDGAPLRLPTTRGELEEPAWLAAVAGHLEQFSPAAFERRFLGVIAEALEVHGARGARATAAAEVRAMIGRRCEELA